MPDTTLAAAVDELALDAIGSGHELGLQVVVIRDGRTIVDTAAGTADPGSGAAVGESTLFWVGSAAKAITSTLAHVLIDRGELTDDLRLVEVWPEFGAHGKGQVAVRHVLCHTAGVPGLPTGTTVDDLVDWDRMCAALADAEPWWAPGTRFGYHAKTFGFVLGETLRRATGCPLPELLEELVTGPLDIVEDVRFGVPAAALRRVAQQVGPDRGGPAPPPGSPLARAMPPEVTPDAAYANSPAVLTADIPSEGTMTARAAARIYSALLGHVDGVELVSPGRLAEMTAITFRGRDEVMEVPTSWAYGYSPSRPGGAATPGSTFGMPGMSGSAAWADVATGVAAAVTRNRFSVGEAAVAAAVDRLLIDATAGDRPRTHRPGGPS